MTFRITRRLPRAIINALRHHGTIPARKSPGPSIEEWDEEVDETVQEDSRDIPSIQKPDGGLRSDRFAI